MNLLEEVGQRADERQVEGVAPGDVGQLVGGDGLELVARSFGQEALGDGDGRRAVLLDDGQRVDGEGRQDVGVDARQAGGDADLVERVEELDVIAVRRRPASRPGGAGG